MLMDTRIHKRINSLKHPHTLVAVDLRKAFDSFRHEAIIDAAGSAEFGVSGLNFIKAFLTDRRFTIRVSGSDPYLRHNNKLGAPQGSILSSILLNLVMVGLARRLDTNIRNTLYDIYTIDVDNIILWATTGDITHQQRMIQNAVNTTDAFRPDTSMSPSPEKTQYFIIYCCPSDETRLQLHFEGKPLHTASTPIKILGISIGTNGWANP